MREDDHPKVIVDDDFLDLRNPRPKVSSRRPSSSLSKNKDSCSTNTQGKSNASKDVLPGLQRLITNFNQKNANNAGYKRPGENQVIDNRFRRKVEKPAMSSRSDSLLLEKDKSSHEICNKKSHTSEISSPSNLSVSENSSKMLPEDPLPPIKKTATPVPELAPKLRTNSKVQNVILTPTIADARIKDKTEMKNKECKMNQGRKDTKEVKERRNMVKNEDDQHNKTVDDYIFQNNTSTMTNKNETKKNIAEKCDIINKNLQKLKWYDPAILLPHGFHSIPSFKKSWTIPTVPLIRKDNLWVRHYNSLCTKVDRKTYEFDTDDTNSIESLGHISSYSSLFRSNYMNLIFCLGCLCGIFLVGGILTASEIQTDLFRSPQRSKGMIEQISYTLQLIIDGLHQILTFPSTRFFRQSTEPTQYWGIF